MYEPNTGTPVKESDFNIRAELYKNYFGPGWTKIYAEKLCEFYARLGRTKFTIIRHSNIYGPYDKYDLERSHVFGATIAKVVSAKDTVTVWGEGKEERDLLHVSDLARFIEKAITLQKTPFELVNVGLGKGIMISDLVKKIIRASGKKLAVHYDTTKPTIPTTLVLDIKKAKIQFKWSPRITLDEGIIKTLAWYQKEKRK